MLGGDRLRRWLEELPDSWLLTGRRRRLVQYAAATFIVSVSITTGYLLLNQPEGFLYDLGSTSRYFDYFWNQTATTRTHPIDDLIGEAHVLQANRLKEQSHDLATAAARYRARRGRHPPPGFDHWVAYALDHDAVVVESFFDRVHADIAPFWGADPHLTAARAAGWEHVINVRGGAVNISGSTEGHVPWMQLWAALIDEAAPFLPDVDVPINYMDESRVMTPWEDIAALLQTEQASRSLRARNETTQIYTGLAAVDEEVQKKETPVFPEWRAGNYWDLTRAACAPDAPSRDVPGLDDFGGAPAFPADDWTPDYGYEGYVRNHTAALDPCRQPHLRGLHGTFAEPLTMATATELVPLFGGCKLTTNNDLLIPGAMYLTDDPMYSGGDSHGPPWRAKRTGAVWRGVASGGRNKKENWRHFQRHRLVQMLNGSAVARAEAQAEAASPTGEGEGEAQKQKEKKKGAVETFEMPSAERYGGFAKLREGTVGEWLGDGRPGFADAGFTDLLCFPADSGCDYVAPYLHTVERMPMREQYGFKFMPDVDGNSFSARFRGFLLSTSLPVKASIYAEWHDDRLVPWLHFAPMDNTFADLYAILDYFSRDARGDRAANFIAEEGRAWANRVLRREDMLLYVWRLLLEFARVCDPERDRLGFVDDLT